MKKLFFLVLALQTSLMAVDQYDTKKVGKIEIIVLSNNPNASYDSDPMIHRLKTRVGDYFSQINFDSDLKLLSEEFDRTEPKISIVDHELHIVITAWPKPLISQIKWKGASHISVHALAKELNIEKKHLI